MLGLSGTANLKIIYKVSTTFTPICYMRKLLQKRLGKVLKVT